MCSGSGIRFTQSHKYLGVTLQAGLKWDMHVRDVTMKAKQLFLALARLGGKGWAAYVGRVLRLRSDEELRA